MVLLPYLRDKRKQNHSRMLSHRWAPDKKPNVRCGESSLSWNKPELLQPGKPWEGSFYNVQVVLVQHVARDSAPLRPTAGGGQCRDSNASTGCSFCPMIGIHVGLEDFPQIPERPNLTPSISMLSTGPLYQNDSSVDITLEQWFSSEVILPPRDMWQGLQTFLVVTSAIGI